MKRIVISILFSITLLGVGSASSIAAISDLILAPSTPLYELGLFTAQAYTPDYPGSNQNHLHGIVFPFILYRGHYLRADDRDGMRARIILADRVRLELSFAGSFPVDSRHDFARHDMPNLDWLGEVGPRLSVTLMKFNNKGYLNLMLPIRGMFSTNFENLHQQGFDFSPGLLLDTPNFIRQQWRGVVLLSSIFGDRNMNNYFYEVGPQYATPDRPEYHSREGYVGSDLTLGLMIPFKKDLRFFTAGQFGFHEFAANMDSPLFKTRNNLTYVLGVSWTFFKSKSHGSD